MSFGQPSQSFNFNFSSQQPSGNNPFAFTSNTQSQPPQQPARRIAPARGAKGRSLRGRGGGGGSGAGTGSFAPVNILPSPVDKWKEFAPPTNTPTPTNPFTFIPQVRPNFNTAEQIKSEHLDRYWLLNHVRKLDIGAGGPRLTEPQLFDLSTNVIEEQVRRYEGQAISAEVLGAIGLVIAAALSAAKAQLLGAGLGVGVNVGERRDSVHDTGSTADMATPQLGQYLNFLNGFIKNRNEAQLCDYIQLEPPFGDSYQSVIRELQTTYPKGNEVALEQKCTQLLTEAVKGDDGSPWTSFVKFMVQYLCYLRDVSADPSRYLETYELLSELQQRANSALGHSTLGHMILPTVVGCAKLVCRLAIGLDKQPDLIAHLKRSGGGGEEGGARETLPERAANILRAAFVTCLNDRVSGLSADGRPEGKKRGIYLIANLCLKILFQCRKTRNATQIFENIYNLSPPLAAYPKSQRVTYLYYLGRFLWQNSHFYRAQVVLQEAYDEAPARPECVRQRRHILVYLIASNIILGRFPSQALLQRPEAAGLADRFLPICLAIKQGNLAALRRHLDLDGPHAPWFLHFRILLQLQNRCEVLVWRSLVRRIFNIAGTRVDPANTRAAPTVALALVIDAFKWLEQQAANGIDDDYIDPDFAGVDYGDTTPSLTLMAIESKVASLIDQGLLSGFISHRLGKFAVSGASKHGGDVLKAGFPNVWEVLRAKAGGEQVPGWKLEVKKMGTGFGAGQAQQFGPGMVVNLSGLREIGAMS